MDVTERRTGFHSPECPVVLIIGCAEARDALWKRDFEGRLELADVGIWLVVRCSPQCLAVVDEQPGVCRAHAGLAGLVRADRDSDGLGLNRLLVLIETGAHNAVYTNRREAKVALKREVSGPCVALGGGERQLDHGRGGGRRKRRSCVATRGVARSARSVSRTTWTATATVERMGKRREEGRIWVRRVHVGVALYGEKME